MTQVTKQWLAAKVAVNPSLVIGRALVAIFRNQVVEERTGNVTKFQNGIGFTQADARVGSLGAKIFMRDGVLPDWQLKIWNGLNRKGEIRILKYAGQLNQIANQKFKAVANISAQIANTGLIDIKTTGCKPYNNKNPELIEAALKMVRP